ncbi:negative transcriptional regulator, PaiB family [Microbulbifer marinus]|uniref:Negative transcriptional regulator, PaiB family n=2 Tax=Microbulbifer marinus TaxID=658218 RepID=A0A1H3YK00_9GAMM|nr:negative transcriptional regulator, PaiB family [Microbulbifer marinus]
MYTPKKFNQTDMGEMKGLIIDYPLATLVTYSNSGLDAHHIPLHLCEREGKIILQGHIAKANPLWREVDDGSNVLAVFNGPNCYISPNHYPTKSETGKAVPTWNYVSVHAKGILSFIHDEKWIYEVIDRLTIQHEGTSEGAWSISDAPESYIEKMLPAIVGLEVEVTSLSGQWKLSQNQPERNRHGVIAGLSASNDTDKLKVSELVETASSEGAVDYSDRRYDDIS